MGHDLARQRFDELVEDSVGGPVTTGVMFGAQGLRTGKKFFAAWWTGQLLVKLPADRIETIEQAGHGEVFVARNRPMKNWVLLNDEADWDSISREARAYVEAG